MASDEVGKEAGMRVGIFRAMSFVWAGVVIAALGTPVTLGQTIAEPAISSPVQLAAHEETLALKGTPEPAPPPVSDAERIARLQRSVESDELRLKELCDALNDPQSDYAKAEEEFKKRDAELVACKRTLQQAIDEKQSPEKVQPLEAQVTEVTKRWTLAREQFQLEIEQRKTQQASIANLETKIAKDKEALSKLKGTEPVRPAEEAPAVAAVPLNAPVPAAPEKVASLAPATLPQPAASPPAVMPTLPLATPLGTAVAPGLSVPKPSEVPPTTSPQPTSPEPNRPSVLTPPRDDKALAAAAKTAQKTAAEAQQAASEAASITERVEILRNDIELQRKLKEGGRKKVDTAEDALVALNDTLSQKILAGESIDEIGGQICEAQDRLRAAKIESRGYSTHLDELQTELTNLQQEQLAAMEQAERARKEAEQAQQEVNNLSNPFTTRNLLHWLSRHGVVVVVLLCVIFGVLYATRNFENRFVSLLANRSRRGSREERENRARTLVTVLQNAACTVTVTVGSIMVLEQFGVPIGPLLGGAAVIGLAVAFGAQSLIKDYFTGFMVLLEQQYMINDVIKIGDITGQVERITLRMTVLRDLEGRVHFLPHGQIYTVTNLTHGWSRAVFDIRIAYKENVDRVMEVLTVLANEMRQDPNYGLMILEDPQMLGVDALAEFGMVVKFCLKTRPLRQWEIKRELLRRIKKRFDELGIEIPYPHQTLYMRSGDDIPSDALRPFVRKAA
jgi:small conductance mechanosensitive channel